MKARELTFRLPGASHLARRSQAGRWWLATAALAVIVTVQLWALTLALRASEVDSAAGTWGALVLQGLAFAAALRVWVGVLRSRSPQPPAGPPPVAEDGDAGRVVKRPGPSEETGAPGTQARGGTCLHEERRCE